ncbi:MAG: hypothetical protein L3K11_03610 [Thermoplasmata archaeon]|nr:hypothetical protein [Thermoplasmata archaeon]
MHQPTKRGPALGSSSRPETLTWLLEPSQPSIRYLTLTRLLGRRETDPVVREARVKIPTTGWVAEILGRRDPAGWWVRDRHRMEPRFLATHWNLLALSDLGATRAIPEVEVSCEYWMANSPLQGGGVGGLGNGKGHHCYTANMARALIRMGYGDDPRIRKTIEWLAVTAHPNGGWTCRFSKEGPATSRSLDAWEGLSAFAVYPRSKWTAAMQTCVERGAEYYLERALHVQGDRYEPWYRFHWPTHYYYDLLVGLDVLTALGYGDDPRLRFALELLRQKQRSDGRWNLDADQPDPDPESAVWYAEHPKQRPTPLSFEVAGRPSKMITLRALTVLSRLDEPRAIQKPQAAQ